MASIPKIKNILLLPSPWIEYAHTIFLFLLTGTHHPKTLCFFVMTNFKSSFRRLYFDVLCSSAFIFNNFNDSIQSLLCEYGVRFVKIEKTEEKFKNKMFFFCGKFSADVMTLKIIKYGNFREVQEILRKLV